MVREIYQAALATVVQERVLNYKEEVMADDNDKARVVPSFIF